MDIFGEDKGSEVILPTKGEDEVVAESNVNLEKAISGDKVKSVLVGETSGIELPNFLIDITEVKTISELYLKALNSLFVEGGDTAVYYKRSTGIGKLGYGDGVVLNQLLVRVVHNVLGPEQKVYANYEPGKEVRLVSTGSLIGRRMNI